MSEPTKKFLRWFNIEGARGAERLGHKLRWRVLEKIAYDAYLRGRHDERESMQRKLDKNNLWDASKELKVQVAETVRYGVLREVYGCDCEITLCSLDKATGPEWEGETALVIFESEE